MNSISKGFAHIPQVEQLLQEPEFSSYIHKLSRPVVLDAIRRVLADVRRSGVLSEPDAQAESINRTIYQGIHQECCRLLQKRHQKVINATGTIVHTNLGRSPIQPAIWEAVSQVNTGQSNLEIKLSDGKRGQRKGLVDNLLAKLTGADDALVVNNNASSVYLMLNELAAGKEVIVSRGEQIQIGGGFRIPDMLALSGAKLVEVGTTNITTTDDYLEAVNDNTAMVLMVHTSNFAIRGFTESPDINELSRKLPDHVLLAVDQGSGLTTERFAAEETPVSSYIKSGADLVCFSGDKIMGGPQAGIVCGKRKLVQQLEKNPLMRVLRPGRVVYSLLEELLVRKLNKQPEGMGLAELVTHHPETIRDRAMSLISGMEEHLELVESQMIVGGGALPDEHFPSWNLELNDIRPAKTVLSELRSMPVPVIGVIRNNRVQLNIASVLPQDLGCLKEQLQSYFSTGNPV